MRIGYLTGEYPGQTLTGGVGVYVQEMAHELRRMGHETFVLLVGESSPGLVHDGEVPVHLVDSRGRWPHLPFPIGRRGWGLAATLAAGIRDLQLDVVEAPEWEGLTAFLHGRQMQKTAVVVKLNSSTAWIQEGNEWRPASLRAKWRNRAQIWTERRAIELADVVTAASSDIAQVSRRIMNVQRGDVRVIRNPVHSSFFAIDRKEPPHPAILCPGRMQWRKGSDIVARAFTALARGRPDWKLRYVGGDTPLAPGGQSMRRHVESLIDSDLRQQLEFLGEVDHSQMHKVLESATVAAFPSRHGEALNIACQEAMAAGIPVVISDAPGIRELIRDNETGLVARTDDPESFRRQLERLLDDPGLRARLGNAARQFALESFTARKIASETLAAYQEAQQLLERRFGNTKRV